MGILVLVLRKILPDPSWNPHIIQGEFAFPVPPDDIAQVMLDRPEISPSQDHLHDHLLHLAGNLWRVAPPYLKPDDINLVNLLPFFPDKVARIALLSTCLEEPPVDLLELYREVMLVGVEGLSGKIRVTSVDLTFNRPGKIDRG